MFDENELDELYDEFLGLDGDLFLESDLDVRKLDNELVSGNLKATNVSNFDNNNFLAETDGLLTEEPNVSIQLDLLNQNFINLNPCDFDRKSKSPTGVPDLRTVGGTSIRPTSFDKKLDEVDNEPKDIDEKLTSPLSPAEKNSFHRGGWASDALGLWHSGPSSLNLNHSSQKNPPYQDLSSSVTCISHGPQSFSGFSSSAKRTYSHQQLGAKVEMVYSLLSMLDTDNREDMSKTFLAMSSSPESCHAMRQSGCLPLLIQLIYSSELEKEVRNRAAEALQNIVYAQIDEKRRKREVRVLKLLQQVREYCDELKSCSVQTQSQEDDKHPINATGTLMKLSFDAEHRQAICILGGLHAITDLIQVDHEVHGSISSDTFCITLRRYAGMSLTNLTFGDGKNKALLCSFTKFLVALVDQLKSPSEDLRQVTASVLRNLSWRADIESKQALRNVSAVSALTVSAMEAKKESTLKSILSALWNLSAHCSLNKIDICSVPGALAFLVKMLKYKSSSNTLSIIENAGGILRNVSSHIAVREDYRQILRDNNCFEVLLEQLKSPSLTIVSNACGTLWNLSARCPEDQKRLWEMGATSMLRSLVQSKHKMISMGSSAALKNLLAANPNENLLTHLDSTAKSLGLQNLPTLFVRKKKALEQELNITLAETCDNIEPVASSFQTEKLEDKKDRKSNDCPKRSDSHDSVRSSQSDTVYELLNQRNNGGGDKLLQNNPAALHSSLDEKMMNRKAEDQRLTKRYTTSMIPTPTSKKMNQDRLNEKAKEGKSTADDVVDTQAVKEQPSADSKQKIKKGIPVLKTKPMKKGLQDGISQQHSSSAFSEEQNAFENSETESFERENTFSILDVERRMSDSQKSKRPSSLGFENVNSKESDGLSRNNGVVNTRNEQIDEKCNETDSVTRLKNRIEFLKQNERGQMHRNFVSNEKEIAEHESNENEIPDEEFSKSFSGSEHSQEGNLRELSGQREEIRLGLESRNSGAGSDQYQLLCDNSLDFKPFEGSTGCRTFGEIQKLPKDTANSDLCPSDDNRHEMMKRLNGKEPNSLSHATVDAANLTHKMASSFECDETSGTYNSSQSFLKEDTSEKLCNANTDEVNGKQANACVLPKFKIGSPMTDRRALQMEARKICREIQKDHEFDMAGSLISEVSLISCSSFLDTGDYSLFECSTDTVNFDESDALKATPFIKNHSKSVSQAPESGCSLPSLGSLKNEQIEALDLDNSVLSVASITSEIDENYTKDSTYYSCCTKTYEVDGNKELPEEVTADDTIVSREDDTLNAELLDDDNSLHSQENLPLDTDTFQDETVDRTRPKLTPKEKRKTFQERYKTYTIRDFRTYKSAGHEIITGEPAKNNAAEVPKSSAQDEGTPAVEGACNRFRVAWDPDFKKENLDEPAHSSVFTTLYNTRGHETIQFSKSFDKEREAIPGFVSDSRSLNDLLSVGPSERKELVDNAKLVAFSLKTAVHDWDTDLVSDSEADEPQKTSEIDTATYTKAFRYRPQSRFSLQELQSLEGPEDIPTENVEKTGAKICKPRDPEDDEVEESPKGIRGRRKPLYSSPQKNSPKLRSASSTPVKAVPVSSDTRKSLPQPATCQSPILNREGTFTKENSSAVKKTEVRTVGVIPVLNRSPDSKNSARLNGKNKVTPPCASTKAAGETKVSRISRPLSTYASRTADKRNEADSSQRRPFSAGAGTRTASESAATARKPTSGCPIPQKLRSSSSSHSVKSGNSPTHTGYVKNKALSSQSVKSQSDASLNLMDSKDKGKSKTSKKEVTSKIASLWRKVEESKEKNKNVKDTRVWIQPEKSTAPGENLVLEKEEIVHIPTRTIVHSYTCHALTDETSSDFPHQKRNSQDVPFSGNAEDRRDRLQKRNIISAVVTPYNYNPPASMAAPSGFKEVDNFQKNSLKVTTV